MLLALVLLVAQGVPEAQAIPALQTQPVPSARVVLVSSLAAAPPTVLPPSAEPASPSAAIRPVITPVVRPSERKPPAAGQRTWLALSITLHSSAAFDAWTTRRRIGSGLYHETNPLLKPFANNGSLYAVTQATPAVLDLVGNRMRKSQRTWVRRLWWAPQTMQAATHFFCGARNLTR